MSRIWGCSVWPPWIRRVEEGLVIETAPPSPREVQGRLVTGGLARVDRRRAQLVGKAGSVEALMQARKAAPQRSLSNGSPRVARGGSSPPTARAHRSPASLRSSECLSSCLLSNSPRPTRTAALIRSFIGSSMMVEEGHQHAEVLGSPRQEVNTAWLRIKPSATAHSRSITARRPESTGPSRRTGPASTCTDVATSTMAPG